MRSAIFSILSSIIISLLMGRPAAAPSKTEDALAQQVVSWPGREWPRSTPESQGVDSEQLARLLQWAADADVNIRHVTLIRRSEAYLRVDFYVYESAGSFGGRCRSSGETRSSAWPESSPGSYPPASPRRALRRRP